ncbi:MAG: alpha-N-acetylglucosaminidase C-terminal domain-containing protein [Bacteroidaceae bacterium]|nr:alpha-N-acetylglucosaminidase C-terminal domain-containing protein [Bacteroidaceae bacterium]
MKRIIIFLFTVSVLLTANAVKAQDSTPTTAEQAITGLLNRIGGNGAAEKFEFAIDADLAENGKDVFVISEKNGKPFIKGNSQLSVTTGINWYLNHYAHINLAWNNLTTDLSSAYLPVPATDEKHVCNTTYRYNLSSEAFSNSAALWTWERWEQEIDWMALHGVNAPLNIVGLEVVTRNFLKALGVNDSDINYYISGPAYIGLFATNNLQEFGGHVQQDGVNMNGLPEWWYERQEELCGKMLTRMRELGMQPVLPGFSGQVPNGFTHANIVEGDLLDNGTWAKSGLYRPDIVKPGSESYNTLAAIYYAELEKVMGVSELYSIDPFHEGALPNGMTNEECYPGIMTQLDAYFATLDTTITPKWFVQYDGSMPQAGAFDAMTGYGDRFVALDINADVPSKAMWNKNDYNDHPYIFCMLNNVAGRNGLHGRLESTMNNYFNAIAGDNSIQGIGATSEGLETNPILYDMLFELPWLDTNTTANAWLESYAHARYGVENAEALAALTTLKNSVWNCQTNQTGATEAVILARPKWDLQNVSEGGTTQIYYNPYDVLTAADKLISIKEQITTEDGIANYNYDIIDIVRQAMVDYAAELLPLINEKRKAGNTAEYNRLYEIFLLLMTDLDNMLAYSELLKLERWASLAHEIAESENVSDNDCNWLEWNARTLITTWANEDNKMHDYSNRCWAGLIKDFHYKRWSHFFEKRGQNIANDYMFNNIEKPWTVNFAGHKYSKLTIPSDMTAGEKAASTFNKYFGRLKSENGNYLFPMGAVRDAQNSGIVPVINRGETTAIPLEIGKSVILTSFWIDLNHDGVQANNEFLTVTDNNVTIPADAEIGKAKAIATYRDGTNLTFSIVINENITDARKVEVTADSEHGSASIEGSNASSITGTEAVTIIATANEGYKFSCWLDTDSSFVSNDNPYTYYGKNAATFTASFIENKWEGVDTNIGEDIANEGKFIHHLTYNYYNREPETIYETTTAPTEAVTTIPQIINVAQGASFDIAYNNGNSDGLKNCTLHAYVDFNVDGKFDESTELVYSAGSNGAENTAVCSGKFNVLLPYTMQLGITHVRLHFKDATGNQDATPNLVYDIAVNVTEYAKNAARINVVTNNNDWGSVKVWNNETSASSNSTQLDVARGTQFTMSATIDEGAEFLGWYDQYDRLVSNNLEQTMYAREDATYTARIRRIIIIDGWEFTFRTEERDGQTVVILSKVLNSGHGDLVIPETVTVLGEECPIVGFDNDLFNRNRALTSITLPKSLEFVSDTITLDSKLSGSGTAYMGETIILDIPDLYNDQAWEMQIEVTNEHLLTHFGTCLIASGKNPTLDQYIGGFQLYMHCPEYSTERDKLILKMNYQNGDNWWFDNVYQEDRFTVIMDYDGNGGLNVRLKKADGSYATSHQGTDVMEFNDVNLDRIETLCTNLAKGVDIPKITVILDELPDAFRGCSNLDAIIVEEGNNSFELDENNNLYNTDGDLVGVPWGKEKGPERRKLEKLIKQMDALSSQVADYNSNSRSKITLNPTRVQVNSGPNDYIWTDAADTVEGSLEFLVDGIKGDKDRYFHTNYHDIDTTEEYHCIEVYLGYPVPDSLMQFSYHTRTGSLTDFPDEITVMGTWGDGKYEELYSIKEGLPQEANQEFTSGIFDNKWYYLLRFMIKGERTFWHMDEFELYYTEGPAVDMYKIFKDKIEEKFMIYCFQELIAAGDVYENGTTSIEMIAAREKLQLAFDELLAQIRTIIPFDLTLFEEEPILYNVQINRDFYGQGNNTVLEYDEEAGIVRTSDDAENSTSQAWYFRNEMDGVLIYPFNGFGKVLSADDNEDGETKVWAVEKGSKSIHNWFVLRHYNDEDSVETGWWNIRDKDILEAGNYFSNNGSWYTKTMGFWHDKNDEGSQFKFIPATFTNDNPRYYQLEEHIKSHPDASNFFEGKTVGLYNGAKAYREAYNAAKALLERLKDTEEMSNIHISECHNAIEALHSAEEKLSLNVASNDKLYAIRSVSDASYCNGSYVHTFYKKTTHSGNGYTDYRNHENLMFCESSNIAPRPLAIFQFETTETEGNYRINNLHTGLYVSKFAAGVGQMTSNAAEVTVAGIADGQVTLRIGNENPMHAQHDYGDITAWRAEPGNASVWEIEEITDISEIYHTLTIGAAGFSTLCLNYPVEIPVGIEAYTAREIITNSKKWLSMISIDDGVIPANTAVVLKGNPGTYVFQYTTEQGKPVSNKGEEFELKGTLYDTYIGNNEDENYLYYVLSVVNGEIGLYRTKLKYNASGAVPTEGAPTHFLNNANKIYLQVKENSTLALSSFINFTFDDGIVSDIEEVVGDREVLDTIYDLQGRRINEITKPGIYIVNGNKVLVK